MTRRETDVYVVWDKSLTDYNFGHGHPMHPVRLDLTAKLATEFGLFDHARIHVHAPDYVEEDGLSQVHTPAYIEAVKSAEVAEALEATNHTDDPDMAEAAEADREAIATTYGVGTEDVPRFHKIHEASGRIFQGSVEAARAIASGRYERAVNFCGGFHHAMPARASGFCVYNDLAGAIHELLAAGYTRIAYIDLDAHHGDGTERIFWDDDRVLTISIHEDGRFLFPWTGAATDIGGLSAAASAVNVALPPRTDDRDWLRSIDAVVPALLQSWEPQIIVSQHGCDGHRSDPLTHLRLSVDAMRVAAEWVRDLADTYTEGKWLATGGGGYSVVDVVPRTWVHLVAISAGLDISPEAEIPRRWLDYAYEQTELQGPEYMTDGFNGGFNSFAHGYNPEMKIDRAIMATRKAVFPFFGLDPHLD